jgi:hypothetical protein
MDRSFYLERLYPLQDRVLSLLRGTDTGFYLSGGTAASRGYLQHRFSDDLDLFVNDDARFGLWSDRAAQALAAVGVWRVEIGLREERFVRATVSEGDLFLKIEMINDVPAHVGPIADHPVLGRLDSAENILANKLTALLDRQEPKDLADVWGFVARRGLSLKAAIAGAQSKAAGIFVPDLARVLLTSSTDDWSRVQWDGGPDAATFVADLHRIGEGLLLQGP